MNSPSSLKRGAGMVIEYLQTHPEFLRDNPALLRELCLPHELPSGVSSLLERQVALLRTDCASLRQELDHRELRAGRQLTVLQNVLGCAMKLLRAERLELLSGTVRNCLRHDFSATLRTFVFADAYTHLGADGYRFLSGSCEVRRMFVEVMNRNKPLTGSLQAEHLDLLFGPAAKGVRSSLLVPLKQSRWDGLVAIGSSEHGRLGAGQERELLVYLFQVFGVRLDQLLGTTSRSRY